MVINLIEISIQPKYFLTNTVAVHFVGREAFTNENGFSFFKNREYWYLGDLATWPPETHFRCVDEDNKCHRSENWPAPSAKGGWVMNKRFGTETIPEIVEGPCPDEEEGEL